VTGRPRCRTCAFWDRAGAKLANAIIDPAAHADVGICVFNPPTVKDAPSYPFPISIWPEVHGDRWCGAWEAPDDGGDGERQPTNVVRFDRSAA